MGKIQWNIITWTLLHAQSDALLLADVFENFWNMCLEIYDLDLTRFLTAPGLARQAALKKTKAKLDLLTDIHMLSYSFDTFFLP